MGRLRNIGRLRAGGSGFNPLSLFAAGEQGGWYDPSDLSSMFQDSFGTTPAALESPVGLMMDKRLGLVLGSEVITALADRTFTSDTGYWTKINSIIGGGACVMTAVPAGSNAITNNALSIGSVYEITYTISAYTSGGVKVACGGNTLGALRNAVGTYTERLLASTGGTQISFQASGSAFTGSVSSISVKQVTGNHLIQATAASRPTLSARYNQLLATEDFSSASWTKNNVTVSTNTTVAPDGTTTADTLTFAGGGVSCNVQQVKTLVNGKAVFHVKQGSLRYVQILSNGDAAVFANFDIQAIAVGTKGANALSSISDKGNGWVQIVLTGTSALTVDIRLQAVDGASAAYGATLTTGGTFIAWGADYRTAADAALSIPTYQRVDTASSYDTSGFPMYMGPDGVDDNMVSPAFAIPAISVMAGAVQFTNGAATVGNVFMMNASFTTMGANSATNYRMFQGLAQTAGARDTASHVMLANFRGDATSSLELDKSILVTGNAGANTDSGGTRLFSDNTGTNQFMSGRFYGGLILARALTAAEKSSLYTYLGSKAGLSL